MTKMHELLEKCGIKVQKEAKPEPPAEEASMPCPCGCGNDFIVVFRAPTENSQRDFYIVAPPMTPNHDVDVFLRSLGFPNPWDR